MKTVYKKCDNCDGYGRVEVTRKSWTTVGDYKESIACPKCNGTGKIETEYFIEEDWPSTI